MTEATTEVPPARRAWGMFLQGPGVIPVKVTRAAAQLGYTVTTIPLQQCAAFFIEPARTIFVNALQPPVRRRFSVAHEIGHILLEHELSSCAETRRRQERDANVYAAELLMPEPFIKATHASLKSLADSYDVPIGEWAVEMIAAHFWVSRRAAWIRMRCLDLF